LTFLLCRSNFEALIHPSKIRTMKKLYTVFFAMTLIIIANLPTQALAQCTCSGGLPATAITYYTPLDTTNAGSSTISFPKFDPSIGTLSCANFDDTISGITTTNVWNKASTKTLYKFLLTVANNIAGPGVSVDEDFTKIYGPDSLNAMGNSPGDSIVYGPDNLFNNVHDHTNVSNLAPYLGSGNVNYTYTLNGGLISLVGSLNYGDQIITNYWGGFRLTYYWCPSLPLALNLTNFIAFKNGKNVQLQWQAVNEQSNIMYDVEYSKDGSTFQSAGNSLPSTYTDGDSTSSYQFLYPVSNVNAGKLYFRIKRVDAAGKSSYTAIKIVNIESSSLITYQVYPNPVVNTVVLEFSEAQTGNFAVSLVNALGQPVQQKMVTLSGTNQIKLDLNNKPAAGLYYLHAKDQAHNIQYVTKVFIK